MSGSYDAAADERGALARMSDDEFRGHCWRLGHGFAAQPAAGRVNALATTLDEALRRPPEVRYWGIAPFRDAAFSMSDTELAAYLARWSVFSDQAGGLTAEQTVIDATRLLTLLPEGAGKAFLRAYAQARRGQLAGGPYDRQLIDALDRAAIVQPERSAGAPRRRDGRRVVLIVPPFLSGKSFLQPPLGFLLLATRLRGAGFDPAIFDLRTAADGLAGVAAALEGALLVAVCTTPYDQAQNYFVDFRYVAATRTVDRVRALLPAGATLAVCGSHGTVRPDLVMRDCRADYVIRGEYDEALLPLALYLRDGGPAPAHALHRDALPALTLQPLDRVPTDVARAEALEIEPAYDLVQLDDYFGDGYEDNQPVRRRNWATLLANRGCPFTCDYCFNFWGRKLRRRDVVSVADELERLQRRNNVRHVFILDFTFTADRGWVVAFCEEYRRRRLSVAWICETRVDCVDAELLGEMARSGCRGIWFGVESFAAEVVGGTGKYPAAVDALAAIRLTRAAGIDPHLFIMLGLPGETSATLGETIRQIRRSQAPYTQSIIVATPRYGTPYYGLARAQFVDLDLDGSFLRLNAVRGLVGNTLTPAHLGKAITLLQDRRAVFGEGPLDAFR